MNIKERVLHTIDKAAITVSIADEDGRFSKKIVILSLVTIYIFTAIVFYFSWHGKVVPDSLIYSFFGAMSVELGSLAGIRVAKNRACNIDNSNAKEGNENGGVG